MIGSARDFPWDDPHDDQLKDWVNYSQNLVCNHYYEKFLIHGDPDILCFIVIEHVLQTQNKL